ncbi:DUF1667 domain-containing protein [Desulfatiglans anilini]|uniref:DUF1667 domain-containing protein n=1 Tax=Desulfatiglans anilini TaxID=90728 RepID=UPI00040D5150|nr:DUF1667 domain-containing protein [Desulfatiglans anilini]
MKTKQLTCVICPNGCELTIAYEETPAVVVKEVSGHTCDKGLAWAEQELLNPVRTIASSIAVESGAFPLVSVRTDSPIPLDRITGVMQAIRALRVTAPVRIGDVLLRTPAGTACNIVATRHVAEDRRSKSAW